jgi:hypothetical protein
MVRVDMGNLCQITQSCDCSRQLLLYVDHGDESERASAHARLDDVVHWLGCLNITASPRVFDFPQDKNPWTDCSNTRASLETPAIRNSRCIDQSVSRNEHRSAL